MRWLLLFVAACTGSRPHMEQPPAPDAADDASTTDSSAAWFARIPSAVALGAATVAWSEREAPCSLEAGSGCDGPGPMIILEDAQGQLSTLVVGIGASSIAGDENGWFYVDIDAGALMRVVAGGSPVRISGNSYSPIGPVLDASYVYWWEPGANGVGRGIMRASRTGDGSDATMFAQTPLFQDSLVGFAGDLWWSVCSTSCTVYRASREAPVRTGAMLAGADANALYVVEPGLTWNLLAMASDGTTTTLLANQPQQTEPHRFVVDGPDLFWATGGSIYHAVANGTPARVATTDDVTDDVFTVTPTQIFHSFTPHGYTAVAR